MMLVWLLTILFSPQCYFIITIAICEMVICYACLMGILVDENDLDWFLPLTAIVWPILLIIICIGVLYTVYLGITRRIGKFLKKNKVNLPDWHPT